MVMLELGPLVELSGPVLLALVFTLGTGVWHPDELSGDREMIEAGLDALFSVWFLKCALKSFKFVVSGVGFNLVDASIELICFFLVELYIHEKCFLVLGYY